MNASLSGERVKSVGMTAAARMATVLILGAMAALTITSRFPSQEGTAAQGSAEPSTTTAPLSGAQVSRPAASFAFGYVEFDWDPSAPGGVPGFDSWPPASQR